MIPSCTTAVPSCGCERCVHRLRRHLLMPGRMSVRFLFLAATLFAASALAFAQARSLPQLFAGG